MNGAGRLLLLYGRSRGAGRAVLVVGAVSATAGLLSRWLVGMPQYDEMGRLPVATAAALATAVALAGTLPGSLPDLEASSPRCWPAWRACHSLAALVGGVLVLAPALPLAPWGAGVLLRDAVGLLGLALLTAAVLGARLAWTLPCAYTAVAYLVGGVDGSGLRAAAAFLTQPEGSRPAALAALVLGVAGAAAWAARDRVGRRWVAVP